MLNHTPNNGFIQWLPNIVRMFSFQNETSLVLAFEGQCNMSSFVLYSLHLMFRVIIFLRFGIFSWNAMLIFWLFF